MGHKKVCEYCGEEFESKYWGARFCSKICSNRANRGNHSLIEKTCVSCGRTFLGTGRAKYCSDECRKGMPPPPIKKEVKISEVRKTKREKGISYAQSQREETLEMFGRITPDEIQEIIGGSK